MKTVIIEKYAVIGNPIEHSKSPLIHGMFAQQVDDAMSYDTLLGDLDAFEDNITTFKQQGGKGLNVTVPFKEQAWELADELSDYAQRAGAVNTLCFRDDGTLYGANTDGVGLLHDSVVNYKLVLEGKRVLLLGAGGASKGVVQPLMEAHIKTLVIANRTPERATQLALDFADLGSIRGGSFNELRDQAPFDLIINATAASLHGIMPPIPESCLFEDSICYDLMYASRPTAFEYWCEDQGAALVLNGLGMLVEQAAASYEIWRGRMPLTTPVLESLQ